jgi:hypothetical protein
METTTELRAHVSYYFRYTVPTMDSSIIACALEFHIKEHNIQRWRNETKMMILLGGSLQNLKCVSIHGMK